MSEYERQLVAVILELTGKPFRKERSVLIPNFHLLLS